MGDKGICPYFQKGGNPEATLVNLQNSTFEYDSFFQEYAGRKEYVVEAVAQVNDSLRSRSNTIKKDLTPRIWIPTTFSPTGDGLNDNFKISGTGVAHFHLTV